MHALWWGRGEELRATLWLAQRALNMYQYIWDARIRRHLAQVADHPRLRRVLTPPRRALIERLLTSHDRAYDRLAELPQTLLHHDFWTANLGQRRLGRRTQTVLVDWSYVGPGTPGAELSQLMVLFWQMEQFDAPEERFLGALVEGLEERLGQAIDPEIVVQGYELSYCLRQMHILAGPILGYLLAGRPLRFGSGNPEMELALVEKLMAQVERGAARL